MLFFVLLLLPIPSLLTSLLYLPCVFFFFFNDTATTEIYTLSLHDALPIFPLEDGEDHREPRAVGSARRSPSGSLRRSDERLHLDEQRTRALARRSDDASRRVRRTLGEEERARVLHLAQPRRRHLEDADLGRAAEAVLVRAKRT